MSLSAPVQLVTRGRSITPFPVADGVTIYHGAIVRLDMSGADKGRIKNWADAVSPPIHCLAGVAMVTDEEANPGQATGNAAGDVFVNVQTDGFVLPKVAVVGYSGISHNSDAIYATDENTFTTSATTGGSVLARGVGFHSSQVADIELYSMLASTQKQGL